MIILALIFSYFIGAIPTAYLFGKALKNIDIRQHGSGNVGATNVFRVLGKGPGFTVLFLDILKGVVAVALIPDLLGTAGVLSRVFCAVSVICGHNWTVFLQFKGGKGVATSLGVLIGLAMKIASIRIVLLVTLMTWIICFFISRIVSLSSIVAAVVMPIMMLLTEQGTALVLLGAVFSIFIVIRHRPNIRRLWDGEEPKVPLSFGKKS